MHKFLYKISSIFAAVLLSALLSSCGSGSRSWGTNTLVLYLANNPTTLNSVSATSAYASRVLSFCYDGLIDIDSNTTIIPNIATNWTWDEESVDGESKYILTFYLRGDVTWQDGLPFTAEDMVFTYECVMNPLSKAMNKIPAFEGLVDEVVALDDTTLQITYNQPLASAVLSWGITPLAKHLYEGYGDDWEAFHASEYNRVPIGNGPYVVKEWKTAKYVLLEKNTNYWKESPSFDQIVLKIVQDDNIAFLAFQQGEFTSFQLQTEQYETIKDEDFFNEEYNLYTYLPLYSSQIAWNCGEESLFNDKLVRQAMCYALDRETIAETVGHDLNLPISGPFAYGSWAYDHSIEPREFDLEKAAKLLSEAGWNDSDGDGILDKDGVKFEFELTYSDTSDAVSKAIVDGLQSGCAELGVLLTPRSLEWSALEARLLEHNFDGIMFAWSHSVDPDVFDMFHSSQIEAGINIGEYSNTELDEMLVTARQELDPEKRAELSKEIHAVLADEVPYTYLFAKYQNVAAKKELKGVEMGPDGFFDWYPGYFDWYFDYEESAE